MTLIQRFVVVFKNDATLYYTYEYYASYLGLIAIVKSWTFPEVSCNVKHIM